QPGTGRARAGIGQRLTQLIRHRKPLAVVTMPPHVGVAGSMGYVETAPDHQSGLGDDPTEGEAYRDWRASHRPGGMELARVLVEAEWDYCVGVLVADEHQPAGRVDIEPTWDCPLRRRPANQSQLACRLIDAERDDAVVSAIRAVHELPTLVDYDLS